MNISRRNKLGKLTHTVVTTTTMCIDAYGCTCTQQHTHADMMQMQWRQCNEMKPNQKRSSRQTMSRTIQIDGSINDDSGIVPRPMHDASVFSFKSRLEVQCSCIQHPSPPSCPSIFNFPQLSRARSCILTAITINYFSSDLRLVRFYLNSFSIHMD